MGLTDARAKSSLRLSLSRLTTPEEITRTAEILPAVITKLRTTSLSESPVTFS